MGARQRESILKGAGHFPQAVGYRCGNTYLLLKSDLWFIYTAHMEEVLTTQS